MRLTNKYRKTLKHFTEAIGKFFLAMDASPSDLLYAEISRLNQEVEKLKIDKRATKDYHEAA